jgi:hypothetical protein
MCSLGAPLVVGREGRLARLPVQRRRSGSCQSHGHRTRPYISPSPAGGGTPPPSRFLGSTMIRSMRPIPLTLVLSGAFQPCILASTSIARILSDALIFHRSNLALAMLSSFSVAHAKFASIVLASFSFAGFCSSATYRGRNQCRETDKRQ